MPQKGKKKHQWEAKLVLEEVQNPKPQQAPDLHQALKPRQVQKVAQTREKRRLLKQKLKKKKNLLHQQVNLQRQNVRVNQKVLLQLRRSVKLNLQWDLERKNHQLKKPLEKVN